MRTGASTGPAPAAAYSGAECSLQGQAHNTRGRTTTTQYAPLSRAHCCFFCWTNDAGLLTDSIAQQYSLHFLMPRIAHTLRFFQPQRSYGAPANECYGVLFKNVRSRSRIAAERASRFASRVHSLSTAAGLALHRHVSIVRLYDFQKVNGTVTHISTVHFRAITGTIIMGQTVNNPRVSNRVSRLRVPYSFRRRHANENFREKPRKSRRSILQSWKRLFHVLPSSRGIFLLFAFQAMRWSKYCYECGTDRMSLALYILIYFKAYKQFYMYITQLYI